MLSLDPVVQLSRTDVETIIFVLEESAVTPNAYIQQLILVFFAHHPEEHELSARFDAALAR